MNKKHLAKPKEPGPPSHGDDRTRPQRESALGGRRKLTSRLGVDPADSTEPETDDSFAGLGFQPSRLIEARSRRGWNQTATAFHLGINATEISKYENGAREPRAGLVARMAKLLDVSADYLLGLTDRRWPHE